MNLDMELLLDAVRSVESSDNPNAVSPVGAKGPYQFMDKTAAEYGITNPFDETQSRDGARRYLTNLYKQFGTVEHALVAYNGGPGRLARRGNDINRMPEESQNYLRKVMAQYAANVLKSEAGVASQHTDSRQQPVSALESLFPGKEGIRREAAGSMFPNNHENEALRASVLQPKSVNEASRIYDLQLQTGLPVNLIQRNLDEIESKVKQQGFDAEAFRKESPMLAEWLAQNPTRASLAQGDYENLTLLEKTWQSMRAVPMGGEHGIKQEQELLLSYKAAEGTITPQEEIQRKKLQSEIQEIDKEFEHGVPWAIKQASSIVGLQIPMLAESAKRGVLYGLPTGAVAGGSLGLLGGPGAPVSVPAGALAGGILGTKMVAGATYAEQSYKLAVAEAFNTLENVKDINGNPIDPVAARYGAFLVGVPNALMEFASVRMAIKVIPGADKVIGKFTTQQMAKILAKPSVMAALADFGKKYAASVGTETFTEGMQAFNTILLREGILGEAGGGITGEDVGGIAEEMKSVAVGSGILAGLASGPRVIELYHDMEKAAMNEEFMRNLGDLTANSKTFANSPKAFKEYIAHLKKNGPIKNVFIPVEQWNILFQDQAPIVATEVFGDIKQYAEAQATGSDLVIPIETYAEKLAGTQFHEQLLMNSRLNPGEMTPTEALEAEQAEPEIVAGLELELAQKIEKEKPLKAIYDDVFQKSRSIGLSQQQANRNATIWRDRIEARAERLGIDPAQLYAEQPLGITREFPAPLSETLTAYNQQLAEPPVPFAEKLPLVGGEIDLPPATPQEITSAMETVKAASASEQEFGVFGATIHPVKGNLAGTEGVAVAGYPQRGVVTDGAPTASDLQIFMRRNRDIFQADPNAALGVWVDSESGKGYIDITNVLPRDMAIAQGEYLGEKAVWDLQAFDEIRLPIARETGQGVLFQAAFHGSRAKFDKFMLEHIGTGEGAQAFGWGLYFTDKKAIAESYRENLTQSANSSFVRARVNGRALRDYLEDFVSRGFNKVALVKAGVALKTPETTIDQAIENLEFERGKRNYYTPGTEERNNEIYDQAIRVLDEMRNQDITWREPNKGQLYKVDIPKTEDMLLWDEPLANQPEIVKKAIGYLWPSGKPMDGSTVYHGLIALKGSDKAASEFLNSLGIPGVKYLDHSSRAKGKGTYNYVVFDDSAISILDTYYQDKRGASVPSEKLIALFKGADPSTFMHESAHLWLEELRQDAMRPDAPEQLKQDWETVKVWTGAQDDAITTDAHEMFARGFEAYLWEGNAPSFKLRQVFAELKNWMQRIYKSMTMLDVELTDEVREVMDRLIATDEAIKQNREKQDYNVPLFGQDMMTDEEYGAYLQLIEEAKHEANDSFRAKVLKELRREKTETWRKEKKALQPVVRAELLEQPIYKAAYWLWSGKLPDGTEIPDMAATKLDKQALLDLGVTLTDLPFRYQENGLSPDVVAQIFGFPSGESLVRQLIGLPTLKDAINEEVNRRIREEHGGIIIEGVTMEEAAMEVQNTRQIEVFNMELRLLKRLGARREITHPAILKDIAKRIVSRKKLGELDPRVFEEAILKASQDVQDALLGREFRSGTGRNLDVAFDAKTRQILNTYIFKEAVEQRRIADRSVKKWKKLLFRSDARMAKTYNMDMVNAARAIASAHGIGTANETAAVYMKALEQYDPQSFKDFKDIVAVASGDGRKVEDLTVDDFAIVKDAIDGLWSSARRSKQADIDGVKMERSDIVGMLNSTMQPLVKPGRKRAGYQRAVSKWDKTKMGLLGVKAALTRVEHWVDTMDDGDPNGNFRKFIWQPISEAADRYREARRVVLEKYQKIVESFPKEAARVGKIDANQPGEIDYEFTDKAHLLGALLHIGNYSNFQKLLVGKGWGEIVDGELDTTRWDKFIQRMWDEGVLTKADYKFIQEVWDIFEELKPQAQKVHKELYGFYFPEIEARPLKTPFGVFKGGYYPATVDPFIVEDAAIRREKEIIEEAPSGFIIPTTGRGFTMKRSEEYRQHLTLDVGLIQQSIEKELRFINLEPAVRDVGRIVTDKDFRNHLAELDSEVGSVMLVPWLQRAALQQVEQPSGPRMQQYDKFLHAIRTNTGLQYMAANVSVALQQVTGLSLAATKVKPRYLAGALWRYIRSPKGYAEQIRGSSSFMRNRTATQIMEVQRSIDRILLNPSKYQSAKSFASEHGYFMQVGMQNVVDIITWGGAYEQASVDGFNEKEALRIADSAVRETQGTFAAEDISKFEAGTPFVRAFTMFYSFFNMSANLNAAEFTKAMRKGGFHAAGRALYIYTFGFMIPSVLSEAIVQMLSGEAFDDDDDDGYLDNLLSIALGGQARMATAMVPGLGSAVQVGINMFNDKWYDDRINVSPAVSAIEATFRVPKDVIRLATEDDVRLNRPVKDILTAVGLVTGLPTAPLAKPITYLTDVEQGFIEESDNPAEIARGLISGRAPQ